MKFLILLGLAVGAYAQGNFFSGQPLSSGKSINAPQPALVEMPNQFTSYAAPPAATFTGTTRTTINVAAPTIQVPKRLQSVVDVPHTPLQMPKGGVHIEDVHLNIPQPVISMPKPVIQRKPVVFNLPQPIIQVPQPVIRHKPMLYTVPHQLKLQRPVVSHTEEHYNVPSASVGKSGYSS